MIVPVQIVHIIRRHRLDPELIRPLQQLPRALPLQLRHLPAHMIVNLQIVILTPALPELPHQMLRMRHLPPADALVHLPVQTP